VQVVNVIQRLNAAEEMLITGGLEAELCLATKRLFELYGKHKDAGPVFVTDENQDAGLSTLQTHDFVFARRKRSSCGHELKRDVHYKLINGLGLRRNSEPSEAGQHQEQTQILSFQVFSFVRFGVVAGLTALRLVFLVQRPRQL
jgi:hypothetical protein